MHIDIVDYPGEWLLDLPLLSKSYTEWSRDSLAAASRDGHRDHAGAWLKRLAEVDPHAPADEALARELADAFTAYLTACRADSRLLSTQPPGRFLMPGDLDNSPALTFAPLRLENDDEGPQGSLARMMDAPLPGLSQRRGAPLLPRSLRPPRPADRDGRRADRAQRRAGRHRRSRSGACRHPRLLPARAHQLAERIGEPAHRPHPLRRHQGRPASPRRPRPPGGDPRPAGGAAPPSAPASPAPASRCWRWPRCAPPARRP